MSKDQMGEERWPGAEYRRRLGSGELAFQVCSDCGTAVFFPRVLCTGCGSTRLGWQPSAGRGTVYSATTVYRRSEAHTVALVDLDEGPRIMMRVEDATPGEPPIGRPVRVQVVEREGEPVPVARLGGEADG